MKIDRIIRTNRRTIALIVEKDGSLLIRAPIKATTREIKRVVDSHQEWIRQKQEQVSHQYQSMRPHVFAEGELFWFLGEQYPLSIAGGQPVPLRLEDRFILSQAAQANARPVFEAWYKAQARHILKERVEYWAGRAGLSYAAIKINSARTRWGSCSARGSLNFSWRLVLAPPTVIDYVVVHELAHLRQRNHSPAFWREVENMLPGYRQPRQWLKQHGHTLGLDNYIHPD